MCGLVGILNYSSGGLYSPDIDIFEDMLVINALRGKHSTGIFGVHKDLKETSWTKAVGSPFVLLQSEAYNKFRPEAIRDMKALIGHGRYATKGAINQENAHPFEVGNITMVHNGVLRNGYSFDDFKEFEVDSQFLAHMIHTKGIEETYKSIEMAAAIIYFDKETNTLNAIRNSERPLNIMLTEDVGKQYGKLLISSELATLNWIKDKHSIKGCSEPMYLVPNTLYSFNMSKCGEWETKDLTPYSKRVKVFPLAKREKEERKKHGGSTSNLHVPKTPSSNSGNWRNVDILTLKHGVSFKPMDRISVEVDQVRSMMNKGAVSGHYITASIPGISDIVVNGAVSLDVARTPQEIWRVEKLEGTIKAIRGSENKYHFYIDNITFPQDDSPLYVRTKNKLVLTKKEYDEIIFYGCDNCKGDILRPEDTVIHKMDGGHICLCHKCTEVLN